MSKSTSTSRNKGDEGKWLLGYDALRSTRLPKMEEFRDDVEKHHQRFAGTEIGPYMRTRTLIALPTVDQPMMPLEEDFPAERGDGVDIAKFQAAMDIYERDKSIWIHSCKNVSAFQHDCNKTYLPKLFVYIQGRLDSSLRVRVEAHETWREIESASPRDPLKLMALIELVMSKSDTSADAGYSQYESLKDLFSSGMAMKSGQSLADYEKFVRDRMRFIQSKACWRVTVAGEDGNPDREESIFDEEFFVNLFVDNLSKVFDTVKIDYTNAIASSSIERKTTFDDMVKYLSAVRTQTGQHVAPLR